MSRTNPDPVFAAAARAELERRVRSSSSTASSRRRPWVMEFAAIAGVLLLVAGIAVGITAIRPGFDANVVPAGAITGSPAPEPTQDPPATPLVSPTTDAPTTPQPTASQATEAPTVSVSTAPATPAPTGATTPPPTIGTSALIGPTGAQQRSSAEIRSWALSLGNDEIWAEQAVLDADCMAQHGFLYDPEFDYRAGLAAQKVGLTAAQYQAFQVAYSGPETGAAYDWRTAGCHGLSVHVTGQDDNH